MFNDSTKWREGLKWLRGIKHYFSIFYRGCNQTNLSTKISAAKVILNIYFLQIFRNMTSNIRQQVKYKQDGSNVLKKTYIPKLFRAP
jgi:hypothetical protein